MASFRSKNFPRNSSSEDSDSSDDEKPWKRKCDVTVHKSDEEFVNPLAGQKPNMKNVKFSIWSNVITDQTVTGELRNFDLVEEKKSDTMVARDVESYRVTSEAVKKLYPDADLSSYQDMDAADEDEMDADEQSEKDEDGDDFMKMLSSYKKAKDEWKKAPKDLRENLKSKKRKFDLREKICKNKSEQQNQTGSSAVFTSDAQFQSDVPRAKPTDTKDIILKCVLDTLQEKNDELFQTIVDNISPEKVLELLNRTEEVENGGGMLIKSGIRRRTPGGVYIQLLRIDKVATPDLIKLLFPPLARDKEEKNRRKKEARRRKRRAAAQSQAHENLMDVKTQVVAMERDKPRQQVSKNVVDWENEDAEDGELLSDE